MTTKEKLEKAKARAKKSGRNVTTGDKKTKTTTAPSGWSITTGVQKKTLSPPKHKASPAPTAGKTIKYGKSMVVDLGHNPTKSAISKGTTQLRTAAKTTKPKAKKNTASAVPKVKVPQIGAPTTTPDTKSNTAGKIVALGVAAAGVGGVAAAAMKKVGKKPAAGKIEYDPPKGLPGGEKGLPGAEKKLPGAEKKLPAPPKGLPGPEKTTRRQVVDDFRAKSAPKVAKVTPPTGPTMPAKVKGPSTWAERGVRGRTVDLTVPKARPMTSITIAAAPKAPKGTRAPSPVAIAEARAKGGSDTYLTGERLMTDAAQEARGKAAIQSALKGQVSTGEQAVAVAGMRRRPGSPEDIQNRRMAAERREATTRRTAEQRRAGVPEVKAPETLVALKPAPDTAPVFKARSHEEVQTRVKGVERRVDTETRATVERAAQRKIDAAAKYYTDLEAEAAKSKIVQPPKPSDLKLPSAAGLPVHGAPKGKGTSAYYEKQARGGAELYEGRKVTSPEADETKAIQEINEEAGRQRLRKGDTPRGSGSRLVQELEAERVAAGRPRFDANERAAIREINEEAGRQRLRKGGTPRGSGSRLAKALEQERAKVAKVPEVKTPQVGRFPTHPEMGGLAADQKGRVPIPLKGVTELKRALEEKVQPKVGRLEGVPEVAPVAKPKADKNLKRDLARAQATNVKLKAEVAAIEAPVSTAPIAETAPETTKAAAGDLRGVKVASVEPTSDQLESTRKTGATRQFYRKRKAARKVAAREAIEARGIATIPTDPAAGAVEEAVVQQKQAERNLLDATARAAEGGKVKPKPAPVAVGATDKRTAGEVFGEEAVRQKTRTIAAKPPDLETTHGGGRQRGTIADIIAADKTAQTERGEQIRSAAAKVRNVAASRGASSAQMEGLEKAVDAEYDRALESYFDEAEGRGGLEQRGPTKPDQRPRLLDPIYEAETELATAREAASPPAPSDRKTIDQKITLVKKRMKAGGESIYKGGDTLKMLENLRDNLPQEAKTQPSTRALPPVKDLTGEQFGKGRPSVRAAGREGMRAGERAVKAKMVSGEPGPVKVPDMTKPGVIPAGPKTPPVTPAREYPRVEAPTKSYAQLWSDRASDWGRRVYQTKIKSLTSPALDIAGEKAKTTAKAEGRVRAAKGVAKGLGVATVAFAGLGAAEAGAREHDPKKRVGAAAKQFKTDIPEVAKGLAAFTGIDLMATRVAPAVVGAATKSAVARGMTLAAGKLGVAGLIGYHAIPFAISQAKKLASAIGEAQFDKGEAAREKKASEAKYGTVEQATRTRHAREAYKRRQALEAKRKK